MRRESGIRLAVLPLVVMVVAVLGLTALWRSPVHAFEQYSQSRDATNCRACHGDFRSANQSQAAQDPATWPGNMHDVHRNTWLAGQCNVCHRGGGVTGTFPVLLGSSLGTSLLPNSTLSCLGCHGRAETAAGGAVTGAGLRQHHERAVGPDTCGQGCHTDNNPATFPTVAENVLPPYYANRGSLVQIPTSACADAKVGALGLDNDGNDLYDAADPACAAPTPNIAVSPTALAFGSVIAGTTSGAQTVTVRNTGTAALTVSGIATDSADFAVSPAIPPAGAIILAPGGSQALSVTFTPSTLGARTGTLTITSTDPDTPTVAVSLTGTGAAAPTPNITVSPLTVPFGSVALGATSGAQTVTVRNTGTAALTVSGIATDSADFAVSPAIPPAGAIILAPGGSQALSVTFTPSVVGPAAATLTIASDDPDTPAVAVSLTGTGVGAPNIGVSPPTLNFGNVTVGTTSGAQTVTVQNTGTADLTVSGIATDGADFAVSPAVPPAAPIILPPGASQTLSVTFAPGAVGPVTGTLTITSDDPDTPTVAVSLTGTGVAGPEPNIVVSPLAVPFGDQVVGTTSGAQTVTVQNTGTADLTVSGIATDGADFAVSPAVPPAAPIILPPGGSQTLSVTFTPGGVGPATGTLTIASDDADTPTVAVSLTGTGVAVPAPSIVVSPLTVPFGDQVLGTTSGAQTVTVQNTGTADLTISGVATDGADFAVSPAVPPAAPIILAPGGSQTLSVTFTPGALGPSAGTLTIASDDPDTPTVTVSLTGVGVAVPTPDIVVSPLTLPFGDVFLGSAATQSVTVRNTGAAALTVSGIATDSADFAVSPAVPPAAPIILPPGGSQVLSVTFAPGALGPSGGTLTITSDDPDTPTVPVALSGTGVERPAVEVDLDIRRLEVSRRVDLKQHDPNEVRIRLQVINRSTVEGPAPATIVGMQMQGGVMVTVYSQTMMVSDPPGDGATRWPFPSCLVDGATPCPGGAAPVTMGEIRWTATIADGDPDVDEATAVTRVTQKRTDRADVEREDDDDDDDRHEKRD